MSRRPAANSQRKLFPMTHEKRQTGPVGSMAGSALKAQISQAIQDAIAAHIAEYSKNFPDQAWGKGALHARLLPAIMDVLPNSVIRPYSVWQCQALRKVGIEGAVRI